MSSDKSRAARKTRLSMRLRVLLSVGNSIEDIAMIVKHSGLALLALVIAVPIAVFEGLSYLFNEAIKGLSFVSHHIWGEPIRQTNDRNAQESPTMLSSPCDLTCTTVSEVPTKQTLVVMNDEKKSAATMRPKR